MDDEIRKLDALLGAITNLTSERDEPTLTGVRCPKCNWTGFAKVDALYDEARGRVEDGADPSTPGIAGFTDLQLVARLAPPPRRSPVGRTVLLAIILGVAVWLIYRQFGDLPSEFAGLAAFLITIIFLLTRARAYSDEYYDRIGRWRKRYMCRKCGQLVEP